MCKEVEVYKIFGNNYNSCLRNHPKFTWVETKAKNRIKGLNNMKHKERGKNIKILAKEEIQVQEKGR